MAQDQRTAAPTARRPRPGARSASAIGTLLGLAAMSAVLLWAYLIPYVHDGTVVPIGSDTSTYVWRAKMIQATGLASLADGSPFQFQANGSNPDRAGLLMVSSSLRAVLHIGAWRFMWILPPLTAVIVAMAAWALARAIHEPGWAGPIYGLAAATSAAFAVTARGYFDNLLADPLLIGVGAVVLMSVEGKPGLAAGIMLLVAALVTHWAFGVYFLVVLAGFAVLLVPASIQARRRGGSLLTTPSARALAMAGGSAVAGGAMILWALPGAQEISTGARTAYDRKLHEQLPWYRLAIALPASVIGAAALPFGRDRGPRWRGLLLLVAWLAPVAGAAVLFWGGGTLAMQRILGFAFPIYLLGAAALVALGRFALSRRGVVRAGLAVLAAVLVGVAGTAGVRNAASSVSDSQPVMQPLTYSILRTAGDYLRAVRPTGSIVYVVDESVDNQAFGMVAAFRRMRAQAPGRYTSQVSTYLGDPESLLAGQVTSRPAETGFDAVARHYWSSLQPRLGNVEVVLVIMPFNQNFDTIAHRHPEWQLAPGILLARGPEAPPTLVYADPPVRPAIHDLVVQILLAVLLLTICGIGWSVGLLRSGWADRLMLAPCLGMAAIMLFGILGGRAGVAMRGRPMVGLTLAAAIAGWALPLLRWLRGFGEASPQGSGGTMATDKDANA